MKIRLVEPKSDSNNVYDHTRLPRLGLPQMAAILKAQGHDVLIYVEVLASVDWDDLLTADLVGFSTTTATTPSAFDMADRVRQESIPVVFGGAHVTFLPDEALDHADYVVRGEGHVTLVELVNTLQLDGDVSHIAGLSYHGPGGLVHNPVRPNCDEATFAALPWPDLAAIVGEEKMVTHPIMTQWGCPFNCNFCSVIKMFGRRVRARAVEDVLDQLETVPPGRDVFFYDDNFVVDSRRTKTILRGMQERGIDLTWSAQVRAEMVYSSKRTGEVDTELLELMRDSGCHMVYVGFESVNPAALEEFNKRQTVEHIADSIRIFHEYGISVHGMFVLGCDADTTETIDTTVQFAIDHQVDTVQFLTITPLPGTEFFYQMQEQDRILSYDWTLYDGHHVLIEPKNMTPYDLQLRSMKAMLHFYRPRRVWLLLASNLIREAPFLLGLFLRKRKLRLALPQIALMSLKSDQLLRVQILLHQILGRVTWLRLRRLFMIPIFRRYAYWHTRQGFRQPESRRYAAWLREVSEKLTGQRRRDSQMV